MNRAIFRALAVSLLVLPTEDARAQQSDSAWNSTRVLGLIEHARQRRLLPLADSALQNYKAMASGHVYFYLDRQSSDERTLVKADQIALEVYWAAPDRTKQRIVGLRDESLLPNRMHYHLDHLTVVQNGFGDTIRLGDGDEVRDVLHPAAPDAPGFYDYRLADSLTIRLPGTPEPIRVYEVKVRPKRSDVSALVGSIFIDRAGGDIVRMSFTFTPASYVDRRLDYINISLDNIRWEGKYWLPFEQAVEIRRQIPELDFVAGAVIQGRFKVRDYEFNLELPPMLFTGFRVVAVPEAEREAYPFDAGLFDDLREAGLAPPPQMDQIRAEAARLMRERFLSGLPRLRLHLRDASSVFRYDRAEGAFLGAGLSYALSPDWRAELAAGHALAAERPTAIATLRGLPSPTTHLRIEGYGNRVRDLGPTAGAAGAMNTLSAVFGGGDYLDLYRAHGGEATLRWNRSPAWTLELGARVERNSAASLVVGQSPIGDDPFRPVRAIDGGTLASATVGIRRIAAGTFEPSWDGGLSLEGGVLESDDPVSRDGEPATSHVFVRPLADVSFSRGGADRGGRLEIGASAGVVLGDAPAQRLFLLGGRRTIPGYAYRSFEGDAFARAGAEAARDVLAPWLRLRLTAAAGWTTWIDGDDAGPDLTLPAAWTGRTTDGIRTSAGAGIGLFWDILRLDLVRGLDGGDWQLMLSVDPRLWSIL